MNKKPVFRLVSIFFGLFHARLPSQIRFELGAGAATRFLSVL